jgi:tRNA U34 2-thiouridine synthase MnmA/TrmU
MSTIRALGLLSGGLDSALAARLLIDQGIEVVGLHLESPTACRSSVRDVADHLGIRLETREKGEAYARLLQTPRFGYGRNMNPCVDCRIFMFEMAKPVMEEVGAQFLFTGEVMGQRPMSQTRDRFHLIDHEAQLAGWILRPLSALALAETEPEQRGWVDRTRLLGIIGRGREIQLELAARYGLKHFQSPGGGCLLTDPIFSIKLRDLFSHAPAHDATLSDIELLRTGRHYRVANDLKIVLGRNAAENARLRERAATSGAIVEPDGFGGPTALVCGSLDARSLAAAARLIRDYAPRAGAEARIRWMDRGVERRARLADVVLEQPASAAGELSAAAELSVAGELSADPAAAREVAAIAVTNESFVLESHTP